MTMLRTPGPLVAVVQHRWTASVRRAIQALLVDQHGLPPGMRALIVLAYATLLTLLVIALLLDIFDQFLPRVEFPSGSSGRSLPRAVLILGSICWAVGWAFILAGASDCRRRVFLPVLLCFVFSTFTFSPAGDTRRWMLAIVLPVILGLAVLHLLTHRSARWRDLPVAELVGWLGVGAMVMGSLWWYSQSEADTARALNVGFFYLAALALPYWMFLGIDLVDGSITTARGVGLAEHGHRDAGVADPGAAGPLGGEQLCAPASPGAERDHGPGAPDRLPTWR